MGLDLESVLITCAIIGSVLLVVFLASKRQNRPKVSTSRRVSGPSSPLPFAIPTQVAERMSAAEMLSRLQPLRDRNAQWDVILPQLNPNNDPEVQRLLVDIRGPHLFAPHLGLSVIEEGCKRVLSVSPKADALDALRQATRGQEPFVR
jgi:hypothetical protein